MLEKALDWFGFGSGDQGQSRAHPRADSGHGHTHGTIDPTIATTDRGVWALKWSFGIMAITAAVQLVVVLASGSIALLADTIHNFGDATTAIPLWVAFALALRPATKRFSYGYGRVEDVAGVLIVLIILISALVAGYEAISRLIHPQAITQLLWVGIAGVVGFIGNEVVAVFRIRVGREINSAALIADGYHARADGLTSLAVVLGAVGVWLGLPLADPIIGLLITIAIFGIVWQSARAVFTRMLDGVDPVILSEINHAAEHVSGVNRVMDTKARWIGHRLHADVTIAVDENLPLMKANEISAALQKELHDHVPGLAVANVRFGISAEASGAAAHGHHHAPVSVRVSGELAEGVLEIVDTPDGERLRFTTVQSPIGTRIAAMIDRSGGLVESLVLAPQPGSTNTFLSSGAPTEPHEFDGRLCIYFGAREEVLPFRMNEPAGHVH